MISRPRSPATAPSGHVGDLLINGNWVATADRDVVTAPYDGRTVGEVSIAAGEHVAEAIEAATAAHRNSRRPPEYERADILERVSAQVRVGTERLARLLAAEAGKPIRAARVEIGRGADTFQFAALEARKLAGDVIPTTGSRAGADKLGFTLQCPKGVVGAISPFNFPFNLVCHKIAPAFAAGCPIILKPSGETPLIALELAKIGRAHV